MFRTRTSCYESKAARFFDNRSQNNQAAGKHIAAQFFWQCEDRLAMTMYQCPKCNNPSGEFDVFPARQRFKWYQFSHQRSACRHCGAEVALDENFQKWGLLIVPAIVVGVWDVALQDRGGVSPMLEYLSWELAAFGLVMLFLKRKMVVVDASADKGSRCDPDKPR